MKLLGLVGAALAALTFGIAAAGGAFHRGADAVNSVPPPSPAPAELATIRRLVLAAAAKMGDPSPTGGVLVPTTSRRAELVDVDTAEADIPVYFVLVHGRFEGGTLLTLTVDPSTNRSLGAGVVGAMPDLNAIGRPQPLSLGPGLDLTENVPCANGHQRLAGPETVRHFEAVTAVSCVDGTRTYPGRGQWWVRIRRVAVGSLAGLQRYFEQPNGPKLAKGVLCDDVRRGTLVPTLVAADGRWLVPRTPADGCGNPLGRGAPRVRWHVVSVHKVRLMISAPALAAHCAMGIKDLPGGGIGPLNPTSGGPVFKSSPKTLRVCVYRTPPNDFEVGNFVRGYSLDAPQTARLLSALTGAAPSGSCPNERTFAVIGAKPELWAEVELGGCFRVGRTYPGYGLGGADPSVVNAILGSR